MEIKRFTIIRIKQKTKFFFVVVPLFLLVEHFHPHTVSTLSVSLCLSLSLSLSFFSFLQMLIRSAKKRKTKKKIKLWFCWATRVLPANAIRRDTLRFQTPQRIKVPRWSVRHQLRSGARVLLLLFYFFLQHKNIKI